jgi:hypothetical protein
LCRAAATLALEDQASAGAQSASTALLHPWKATVTLPLSRSMNSTAGGRVPVRTEALLVSG